MRALLRRDLRRRIAPPALTVVVYACYAEPVASATDQTFHGEIGSRAYSAVRPRRHGHGIPALINHITLGSAHRIPTQIDLAIMISGCGRQCLRLRRRIGGSHCGRARIHARAKNQLFITTGYAFDVGGELSQHLIERVLLLILRTGFFLCRLPRGLSFGVRGVEIVCRSRDDGKRGRGGRKAHISG
jgi:hypothetical protein